MKLTSAAYATTALGLAVLAAGTLASAAHANPTGGSVAAGAATIVNSTPLQTDINQTSDKAVINWSSFNIAPNETTNFNQPGTSSVALNRIGDANPSTILGALNANGQLMLINPNGMMFGNNAQVNVGGLVATTADTSNADFMAGNYNFNKTGNRNAQITNNGHIDVADGGSAALVAPTVNNNGAITANMGKVALAGTDAFVLDMAGDNLVNVAVPSVQGPRANAATVNNNGSIIADQGRVALTAQAARSALNGTINNSGIIQARSAVDNGGVISLVADNVNAGGTIDVQGEGEANAGTVNLEAKKNLSFTGDVLANASDEGVAGNGGTVNLKGKTVSLGGTINNGVGEEGTGSGGTTNIAAGDTFDIGSSEAYTLATSLEHGGTTNVSANKTLNLNSDIDTSAQTGAGALNFKDGDANGKLTANLNGKITQGEEQTLSGEANKVNVGSNGSIQNGVDVTAETGGQVNVAEGTFDENVTIDKANLDLRGNNWNVPANGSRNGESNVNGYVKIAADDASVRGLSVNGGISAQNADNATIRNNIIAAGETPDVETLTEDTEGAGTNVGVHLRNADNATVRDNAISGFATGVKVANSADADIRGNSIEGATNGIDANNADGANINGNTVAFASDDEAAALTDEEATSGNIGINVRNSDDARVANNTVDGYDTGLRVANTGNALVRGNTVTGGLNGIVANNNDNLRVQNNTLTGNGSDAEGGTGISVNHSDEAAITGNTLSGYETGAKVANSDGVNFRNNTASDVVTGLNANHADDLNARGNTLTGVGTDQGDGMLIRNSDNVNAKLTNNTVSDFKNARRLINSTEQ